MFEYKYKIENGRLVKKSNGVPIPDDEPLFILRAQDKNALPVLVAYNCLCSNLEQSEQVTKSIKAFRGFADNNPEKMKEPDL